LICPNILSSFKLFYSGRPHSYHFMVLIDKCCTWYFGNNYFNLLKREITNNSIDKRNRWWSLQQTHPPLSVTTVVVSYTQLFIIEFKFHTSIKVTRHTGETLLRRKTSSSRYFFFHFNGLGDVQFIFGFPVSTRFSSLARHVQITSHLGPNAFSSSLVL